jgi:PAS domain S-box-containing protein
MNVLPGFLYFAALVLTGVSGGIIAVYARRFKRETSWGRAFSWVTLSISLLAAAEILSLVSSTAGQARFWFNARILFSAFMPVFWLKFTVEYGGRKAWISRRLSAGLFAVPLITQVILWTNSLHSLWVKRDVVFTHEGPFWLADLSPRVTGICFLVSSLYGMFLLFVGIIILLLAVWGRHARSRTQTALVSAGALVAVANGFLSTFGLYSWTEFYPFTPAFGLSILLIAAALFPFRFFSRAPFSKPPALDVQTGRSLAVFLFIFALLTTGLIAIGLVSFRNFEENLKKGAENQLFSVVALKTKELQTWRQQRRADAEILFSNPSFIALARSFLNHPADPKSRGEIQSWLSNFRLYRQYEKIFVTNAHGFELLSIETSAAKSSVSLSRESDDVMIYSDRVTFLDFHRDGNGPIHVSLIVPINSPVSGRNPARFLGMIVMWINPELYLYPSMQTWSGFSPSGEILLVRREGNTALFLNPLKFDPDAALKLRIPLDRTEVTAVQAVLGREGIVEGVDYRGVRTFAAVRSVPDSPWTLVARMDVAEVLGPVQERLWYMVLFLAALITAAGTGLGMIWRRQRLRFFRSRAEIGQQLRDSLERFELANKATFDVIWDWDLQTDALRWNENFHLLFGVPPEEIEPGIESWTNRIHPEDRDRVISGIHAVIDGGGQFWSDHYRFRCQDGRFLEIFDRGNVTRDASGKPVRMIGAMQDLTERIKAEKAAIHSRDLMRYIIEHDRSAIAILNRDFRFLYVSQSFQKDYARWNQDVIGKLHTEVFPSVPREFLTIYEKVMAGKVFSGEDSPFVLEDETPGWARWEMRPWYEADGTIGGLIIYIENVTERKKADEAIRASLREKVVLLREIHHRVKNNMQVISSLLNLQAAQFGEGRFQEAMKETQRRIRSMALLHEKLYKSQDLSRIDFVEYAQSLATHLLQSFAIDPARIIITFEMDPAFFDIATANPLGLILNEFLSNAMKHAFPGGRAGEIFVGLRRTGDDYRLVVRDNGVGLPPVFDLKGKDSFGIQIVDSLVQQLNGKLNVGREGGGASFELSFRELVYISRLDPSIKNSTES